MNVIDSYSEYIVKPEPSLGSTLLNGVNRNEYLQELNILIREVFSAIPPYSESDYRCGRVILCLVQKYCLAPKAFGDAPQSPEFTAYLNATKAMLQDELKRIDSAHGQDWSLMIDHDLVFTIIANTLQLLTSAMEYYDRQMAEKKQPKKDDGKNPKAAFLGIPLPFGAAAPVPPISLERESTALGDVVPYLDNVWEITKKHNRAKAMLKFQGEAFMDWTEFKYLKMILSTTKMRLDEIGVF